jgi:Flp pilus assembly protein TadD/uncharacterized protein (AIM24 family)
MARALREPPPFDQGVFLMHFNRGRVAIRRGDFEEARVELEASQALRAEDEDVQSLLSQVYFKLGRYDDAEKVTRRLLADNTDSHILHSNLGVILLKLGSLEEAESELRRAVDLRPDHKKSHLYLGLLYRQRKKLGLALEHFRFASADKLVADVEEMLRQAPRETGSLRFTDSRAFRPAPPEFSRETEPPMTLSTPLPRATPLSGLRAAVPQGRIATPAPRTPVPTSPVSERPGTPVPGEAGATPSPGGRVPTPAPVEPAAAPSSGTRMPIPPAGVRMATPIPAAEVSGAEEERTRVVTPVPEGFIATPVPTGRLSTPPTQESVPASRSQEGSIVTPVPRLVTPIPERGATTERIAHLQPVPPLPKVRETAETVATPRPQPFRLQENGSLEIVSPGSVIVRKGTIASYSGKISFTAESSVGGTSADGLLQATGHGTLLVVHRGRRPFLFELAGEFLCVEGSRLLALDEELSYRLEPIHDFRRRRRVDILKIYGHGGVVLSTSREPLALKVTPELPLNISSRDLIGWTGDLVPTVLEDRFLEQVMVPDEQDPPKIRFEGTGTVLAEPRWVARRAGDS